MPRTTLDLDPAVLSELRGRAAREGKPMGRVASELLAEALEAGAKDAGRPFKWAAYDLGEPLIDLEDKEAVWNLLDEESHELHG